MKLYCSALLLSVSAFPFATASQCNPNNKNTNFEEFLEAQKATLITFFDGTPDILGWNNGIPELEDNTFCLADYAGVWDAFYEGVFDTSVDGSVTVRCVGDDMEHVTVNVDATHVLGWCSNAYDLIVGEGCEFSLCDTLPAESTVGALAPDAAMAPETGAYGNTIIRVKFTRPAGAEFVDLVTLNFNTPEGYNFESVLFRARGFEGPQGTFAIQQRGLLVSHDVGFPVEWIKVKLQN